MSKKNYTDIPSSEFKPGEILDFEKQHGIKTIFNATQIGILGKTGLFGPSTTEGNQQCYILRNYFKGRALIEFASSNIDQLEPFIQNIEPYATYKA